MITKHNLVQTPPKYKYLRILSMFYITMLMAATVLAYKIVMIGPIPEPGSTLVFTFSYFFSDVITEVYGYKYSRRLIWESIICGYFFAILITVVNYFPSPSYWDHTQEYNQVLGHVLRFTTAGVIGYLISAFLNAYAISKLKILMKGKRFWLRSLGSSALGEISATFVAGTITFFHMIPLGKIFTIMAAAVIFKLVYGLFAVWPATLLATILKKKEADTYDYSVNFNPFILKEEIEGQ